MKKLLYTFLIIGSIIIFNNNKVSTQTNKQKVVAENIDTLYMEATLVKKQIENKEGKASQILFEFYLVNEDIETFVKVDEGNYTQKELEKYIGKEMLYSIDVRNGKWDFENEKSKVQSRTGQYFVILTIKDI